AAVAIGAVTIGVGANVARGDENPPFLAVPRVSAQTPERFRALFQSSDESIVRVLILGDSQETMPGGFGSLYLPHLNARFAKVFGPAGESMLFTNVGMQGTPHWLASSTTSAASLPTGIASTSLLPGVVVRRLLADDGTALGAFRVMLLHDASAVADPVLIDGPWFDAQGPFVGEILAIGSASPTAVQWSNTPSDSSIAGAGPAAVQSGVLPMPVKAAAGSFHWLETPTLDFGGKRHVQLNLSGAIPSNEAKNDGTNGGTAGGKTQNKKFGKPLGTEVAGIRFRSLSAHHGVVVQSFARGGMRLQDVLGEHAQSGPFLRAMDPSIAVLHFGANDAAYGIGIEEWRSRVLQTVAWIRTETGDPNFPIILASDLRSGPADGFPILDLMPVVAHEIALEDANVLALNLPRIVAEEYRWLERRPYLYDAAHLAPHAQRMLAEAFVGELCRGLSIPDAGCAQTSWADCVRTLGSTCAYGGCVLVTDIDATVLGLPWNGAGTDCTDNDQDGYPDLCPPPASPDINGDGSVDAGDLAILLGAWGTALASADLNYDGSVGAADLAVLLARWGA
ncbi:MAG: hypothetical protein RIR10_2071, partial [Planctomycetota bacterium]